MSQYVRGAALCRSIVAQQARANAGNASSQIQRRSRSSCAVLLRASWAALQQQHLQDRHRTSQQHWTSRQLQVVASSQIVLRQRQWDSTGAAYALVARHPFSSEPPGQQQPPQPHPPSSNKRWALLRPSEVEIEAINDKSESALKDLAEEYRVYREARLHPKKALKEESPPSITDMVPSTEKAKGMISRIPGMVKKGVVASAKFTWEIIRHPSQLRLRWGELKGALREMAQHYYLGSKLLWNDMKTTQKIVSRMLTGHSLTRRERKQLLRTSSDIFRMVPLAIFVIIPFMEFLLPFALKIFPNMLPSTFQDSLKKEENMKKELKMRLALAGFLQDTVQEMASRKKQAVEGKSGEDSVVALKELQEFIEKAKLGHIGNDDITRFARLFKDELTLENTSRAQLVNLCRFMGLAPYGGDNFLRFQLRSHLRAIKQDDQRILWEGVSSLTKQELQEACRERGMRATGLTKEGYRRQLGQWLDLSTAKAVPISLLIMSRAFTLEAMDPASALALSIGAMDSGVVTEVMIEAASNAERKTPEYRAIKLESLERQNELIEQEHKKRQAALAKKKLAEDEAKAKTEAAKAPVDTDAQQHDAVVSAAKAAEEAAASAPPPMAEPVLTESQVVAGDAKVGSRAVKPAPTAAAAAAAAAPAQEAPKADAAAPAATAAAVPADAQAAAAAAAAAGDEKPKKKREITAEELRALESLTNPSSMTKEKAQLAQMKATLSESMAAAKEEAAATAAAVAAVAQAHHAQQAAAAATQRHQQEAYGEAPPPPSDGGSSSTAAAAAPKAAAAAAAAEPKPAQGKAPAQPSTAQEPPKDSPSEAALNVVEAAAAQVEAAKGDDSAAAAAAATVAAAAKSETDDIDKSVQRVQNKLASMLDKLEMDIETVEAKIGDKFHMLDRDRDGVVGAEELAFVIQHVLSSHSTEEEALQIVTDLDVDQDGQISVQELIDWVEKYSAAAEADEVFDDLYSMQHPRGEKRAVGGKRAARDASAKDAAAAAAAAAAADKSQS